MSTCAKVSKFGSIVSCEQSKFQQKIHSKWKMWMFNLDQRYQQMQKILRFWFWYGSTPQVVKNEPPMILYSIVYLLLLEYFYLF